MNAITSVTPVARMPYSGKFRTIRMIREPQNAFGWAKIKTITVPGGWYELERMTADPIFVKVDEQTGIILGWYGLNGEIVNVRVTIK